MNGKAFSRFGLGISISAIAAFLYAIYESTLGVSVERQVIGAAMLLLAGIFIGTAGETVRRSDD